MDNNSCNAIHYCHNNSKPTKPPNPRRRKSKGIIVLSLMCLRHMEGIRSTELIRLSVPVAPHVPRPLPSFTDVRGECEEKNNDSEQPPDAKAVEGKEREVDAHEGHTVC